MAELLLELFSEEIPARMQSRAEADLSRLLTAMFKDANLSFDSIKTYSTPRRITAVVDGLPLSQPDICEEKRGPSINAPEQAIAGFKRSLPEHALIEHVEEKKGTFLFAKIEAEGQKTVELIEAKLQEFILNFPWSKSMRWGSGQNKWVRPLHSIICLFDGIKINTTLFNIWRHSTDTPLVPTDIKNIRSSNKTQGHRFLAGDSFEVTDFADYQAKLRVAKVVLDPAERREMIKEKAEKLAADKGLTLVDDPALLAEVAGLVEWPVPMMGQFDKAFLEVPSEALVSEMKHHQKYFAMRDAKGNLSPHFIFVANIEGDAELIRSGNERVLGARLSDAKFFWDQDRAKKLDEFLPALKDIVFHDKLGTVADKVARVEKLAGEIAALIGCDQKQAKRAAELAKADLVSGMVGEFPDLQGVMGSYYAAQQGEAAEVAQAIREHYSPKGPNDACPSEPVSIALALAEKIDVLTGFFAIDEKPTGSKDPFALRRAALGVIRLITENGLRLGLQKDLGFSDDLMAFFADRLKVQQKEKGMRHDIIDAVFARSGEDDLVRLLSQVSALQSFVETDDGENLLAAYKRAGNIVRIEEKKDKTSYASEVKESQLSERQEKDLFAALAKVNVEVEAKLAEENYQEVMVAIASLRAPLDDFFEDVIVNSEDKATRVNRLNLLSRIKLECDLVADFSKIEG
ncbi:MAG: glycine--tRNA ligase subunit beta [Sphingomonadales bacterium]|nr:glycine--tRNA ligase subunit beta [Sphingomonadales bacterium]